MAAAEFTIIQFEDDDNYRLVTDLICYNMGLSIAASANNISSAKELFNRISRGELKPEIAIVTNFLERDEHDGQAVAKKLKELVPEIKIIAYSFSDDENWADFKALKSAKDPKDSLINALSQITRKEFKNSNQ